VQFGKNMHEWVFQRGSKLHESEERVQFEVFEKLTSVCFSKLHEKPYYYLLIIYISIFAQVNITNPTRWLVKFDVISCYIHLQVNITKQKFSKWLLLVLWKFTDKEISEIKINSVSKNTKACVKILKQLFASGSVIIGEYSPRLRLGEYSPIITSPSANNC
jgi:hypothetical protein